MDSCKFLHSSYIDSFKCLINRARHAENAGTDKTESLAFVELAVSGRESIDQRYLVLIVHILEVLYGQLYCSPAGCFIMFLYGWRNRDQGKRTE